MLKLNTVFSPCHLSVFSLFLTNSCCKTKNRKILSAIQVQRRPFLCECTQWPLPSNFAHLSKDAGRGKLWWVSIWLLNLFPPLLDFWPMVCEESQHLVQNSLTLPILPWDNVVFTSLSKFSVLKRHKHCSPQKKSFSVFSIWRSIIRPWHSMIRQHCRLNMCRYIGCADKYCNYQLNQFSRRACIC